MRGFWVHYWWNWFVLFQNLVQPVWFKLSEIINFPKQANYKQLQMQATGKNVDFGFIFDENGSKGMVQTVTNWFKLDDTGLTRLRQVWAKVWWFDEKGQFRIWTNGIWNVPFLNVQSWTTLRPLAWFSIFSRQN